MLVLGDVHGERDENRELLRTVLQNADDEPVLQVGDLGTYEPPSDLWFVAGNNEDFDVIDELRAGGGTSPAYPEIHLLDGDVHVLDGVRVTGLSGNYAPTRYDRPRESLTGDRRRHFTEGDVARCRECDDVDVLVCHEAPHGVLRTEGYDVGCRPIDELLDAVTPELCLVGHHHRHAVGTYGPTRVLVLDPLWESVYHLNPETLEHTRRPVGDVVGD